MHRLLLLACLLVLPLRVSAQPESGTVEAVDLETWRTLPLSGTDLGSGRIVEAFVVSERQLDALMSRPEAAATVRKDAAGVLAARGYVLRGTPSCDGVADCTLETASCYIVPRDGDGPVIVVQRGRTGR